MKWTQSELLELNGYPSAAPDGKYPDIHPAGPDPFRQITFLDVGY